MSFLAVTILYAVLVLLNVWAYRVSTHKWVQLLVIGFVVGLWASIVMHKIIVEGIWRRNR